MVPRQNYQSFNSAGNSYWFEPSQPYGIWNFEKTESLQLHLNEQNELQNKKRLFITNFLSPCLSGKIFKTYNEFNLISGSKRNLFLLYHFSQSLWQLFLQ